MSGTNLTDQQLLTAAALAAATLAASTWAQLALPHFASLLRTLRFVVPKLVEIGWRHYDLRRRRRRGRSGRGVSPADIAAIVSRENDFMAAWRYGPGSRPVSPPAVCYRIARPWSGTWSGRWPTHG